MPEGEPDLLSMTQHFLGLTACIKARDSACR
jgi:hypothetical protein